MTAALKRTIANSGMSFRAIEKATGVKRQSLMKFMGNKQSLRLDMADRLAAYFEMELTTIKGK